MSHFLVAVFHRPDQSVQKLLEPYDENHSVEPYIWKTKEEAIEFARTYWGDAERKSDEECWKWTSKGLDTDDEGNVYNEHNPQAKWDWWCVGGRWPGMLKTDCGGCDSAYVKDVDFSPDMESYQEYKDFWESYVLKGERKKGHFYMYKREMYLERYKDMDTFLRCMTGFHTRAVVLPDGSWNEVGEMLAFGFSNESHEEAVNWQLHYKERFIDTANPDWIITMVDCHI